MNIYSQSAILAAELTGKRFIKLVLIIVTVVILYFVGALLIVDYLLN
jgi:hypothetical protein